MQAVNFEFIDSLKNIGTKYLFIFDKSCEKNCNSEAFVDIATAGAHHGLSNIYIKHNLFHQSKLGRDVELRNTHIVLFKSPRYMMQVSTHSAQMGLRSALVDWYRDAPSVPFGRLFIDLSPRTYNRLNYCRISGSVPSNIYNPEFSKHLGTLDDEHTKFFHPACVPIAFPQLQKPNSSVLSKRVHPFSMRMHSKPASRKLASHKKLSLGKVSRRSLVTVATKNNLEAKKKRSVVRQRVANKSGHYTSRQ